MTGPPSPVEQEYRDLLARHGFAHLLDPPDPELVREFVERLSETDREFLGNDFLDELRANDYRQPYHNRFDEAHQNIRRALAAGGLELPGEVYVGEYPHRSFNAQAVAGRTGTLILLNTGLLTLLDRVGTAIGASLLTFGRTPDGRITRATATPSQEQQRVSATTVFAESLVTYLAQDGVRLPERLSTPFDERGMFGFLMASSAVNFTVGHEFGHLLAGHLHETTGHHDIRDWRAESLRREHEADELAALLLLRGLDPSADFLHRALAVAGPFLFLALDHLITRVQQEIYDLPDGVIERTHPPSDERAAAVRAVFTELGDPNALQFADAVVTWLSGREDEVLAHVRRLLAD
ncbi:hypothetical protein [Lentzea flava]|uniref:IrrE N-terminal-like domain-containing protein n=1 Tax=Lentzea flava TaxID=103732 RepID=A0ABQ2VB12_9PSEU|nr:hypothetical protein [Lentzea flava]MCP2203974.1 hypothetical protein [Lentzea flava]GGU73350.1 hypothetical protein GCM10010178_76070 [Lentzea flava]